jgi:hypothetical protein
VALLMTLLFIPGDQSDENNFGTAPGILPDESDRSLPAHAAGFRHLIPRNVGEGCIHTS